MSDPIFLALHKPTQTYLRDADGHDRTPSEALAYRFNNVSAALMLSRQGCDLIELKPGTWPAQSLGKLDLRQVTLTMFETRCHELGRMALEQCMEMADFGDVVVFSDRIGKAWPPGVLVKSVPDFPTFGDVSRFTWYEMPKHISTTHALIVQYDSWIIDPGMWRPEFLDYDYIAAPWWYKDGLNVGGGFLMRSARLMETLRANPTRFPHADPEDDLISRGYRRRLEAMGLAWAPEDLAHDFAFECVGRPEYPRHFGFHGMFNWPRVLSKEELARRIAIADQSEYLKKKGSLAALKQQIGMQP